MKQAVLHFSPSRFDCHLSSGSLQGTFISVQLMTKGLALDAISATSEWKCYHPLLCNGAVDYLTNLSSH